MASMWSDKPSALLTTDTRMWALRGAMFLILLGAGIVWVYAGIWMKQNGVGETTIGLLVGAGGAVGAAASLLWGWLSDRTGRSTPIVCAGCILMGVSLIVLSHSHSVRGFCLYQVLMATGLSATFNVMPLLALTVIGEGKPGAGYGRFRLFGSIGYIVGLYVLATFISGLEQLFLVSGVLLLLGVIPLLLANVKPRRHQERHGFGGLLRRPRFLWFLAAAFFFYCGGPAAFTFLALYAREIGLDQASVARLMGMCGITAVVALPLMGSIADRVGAKWILFLAFLAMPLRVFTQAMSVGATGLYVAQLFHFFTWAGPEVTMYLYVTRLVGEQDKGVAISALLTTRAVAGLAANPAIGYLAEHHGYHAMFLATAGFSALGLVVYSLTGLRSTADRAQ